jgi:hypothetical protein
MTGFPNERDTICPAWCELPPEHVSSHDHWENRHIRIVANFDLPEIDGIRSAGEKPLSVEIQGDVDYEQREYSPVIRLSLACTGAAPDEEDLTPDEARAIAVALQRAARLIDGKSVPET